jgi:hypothetical protein
VSARPQFQDILCAAPAESIDPTVDPDDVFDMLLGAILARTLIPTVARRRRPLERTVDLALRLLRPEHGLTRNEAHDDPVVGASAKEG